MEKMDKVLGTMLQRAKSSKDLMDRPIKEYPTDPAAYQLMEDCGRGVSATVHRAVCIPFNEEVAVKKMNLDSMNVKLDDVMKEAQTMRSYSHPNVLPLYTSFIVNQDLYMITPFCDGGSVLHIMKYNAKEGLDEVIIATIMKEVLEALKYIHANGGIHRDVKAGNILINSDGSIMVGDLGVAASTTREGSWGNDKATRTTFVGTPCWMAPEVMEQTEGYDSRADIWSFGITLLEMANGHAPFAKFPPMKVLLMTLQGPAPQLEAQDGRRNFSRAMKEVVALCLHKDPLQRPSADKLLQHKFFRQAKDKEYLRKHLLTDLPPLWNRVKEIRTGKAATNAADNDRQLAASQEEYVKGVSSWNFDVAALKAAAASENDDYTPMPTIAEGPEDREDNSALPSRRATQDASGTFSGNSSLTRPDGQQQQQAVSPGAFTAAQFSQLEAGVLSGSRMTTRSMSAFAGSPGAAAAVLAAGTAAAAASAVAASAAGNGVPGGLATSRSEPQPATTPPGTAPVPAAPSSVDPNSCSASVASPALGSPSISREGSTQGPLNALAAQSAGSMSGKAGKHGRFTCYGPGDMVPPMSPVASKEPPPRIGDLLGQVPAQGPTTPGPPQLPEARCSDGGDASRQPLAPAEQAELLAAATAATTAAGTASAPGAAAASSMGPPKPPAVLTLGTSPSVGEGLDSSANNTAGLEQRGRFKIIKEEGPSRGSMSKVPSTADLRGPHKIEGKLSGLSIGSGNMPGMVLSRLVELQDQATQHQQALSRLVECVRDFNLGSMATTAASTPGAASLGGSAAAAAGGEAGAGRRPPTSATTPLSRSASTRGLLTGCDLSRVTLQQLLAEGDSPTELAQRLLDRVKRLERENMELHEELARYKMRPSEGTQALGLGDGSDSVMSSQPVSRRTSHISMAPLAGSAPLSSTAATPAVAGSSTGNSTVVSPTLSPRVEATPRSSADG